MIKIITIHKKDAKDFLNNNGIGILTDFRSSPKVKECMNGEFYIEFEYSYKGRYAEYLIEENLIVSPVGYGERQAFRINKTRKVIDDSNIYIYVYAKHISYDLVDNNLDNVYVESKDGINAINWILDHTQYKHNFNGYSDINVSASARYVDKNPIQALISDDENSFVNRWGGEIVRDNYSIKMLRNRGRDNGVHIRYRKNLKGIDFETDYSTISTRIKAQGYDGLQLPEKYVDSPLISKYNNPKIIKIEYSDVKLKGNGSDEGYDTLEECYEALRNYAKKEFENGIDKPTISVTVNFVELSKTLEYLNYKTLEKVSIGDTVHIDIEEFDVEVQEKVVSTEYDPILEKFTVLELGSVFSSYTLETKAYEKELEEVILPNYLDMAKENATNLLTTAMGGYIVKTRNELFICDNEDIDEAEKVWRWNINGLGYSSHGINGPYGIAMTMDGSIVADYITAGQMKIARIEGLTSKLNDITTAIELNSNNITLVVDEQEKINEKVDENAASILLNSKNIELKLDSTSFTSAAVIGLINNKGSSVAKISADVINLSGYLTISSANSTYATTSGLSGGTTTINGSCIKTGTINAERINMTSNGALSNGIYVTSPGWLSGAVPSPSGDSNKPIVYFGAFNTGAMNNPLASVGMEIWENGEVYIRRLYCESGAGTGTYMGYIKTSLSNSGDSINYITATSSKIGVATYQQGAHDIYFAVSDENFKMNIKNTKVTAMDYINKIRHIEFNWKEDGKYQQLGFSAQQLKTVCDDFVDSVEQPEDFEFDEILQVRDFNILPYLSKGLQEHDVRFNDIEEKINFILSKIS